MFLTAQQLYLGEVITPPDRSNIVSYERRFLDLILLQFGCVCGYCKTLLHLRLPQLNLRDHMARINCHCIIHWYTLGLLTFLVGAYDLLEKVRI